MCLLIFTILIIRSIFIEPFRIMSSSMAPTVMLGDFIFVNKMAYGFKVPFTGINLLGIDIGPLYLFGKSTPERGDVIVFKYSKDKSIDFIKRVVGLPGDKIEIKNKKVFINGLPVPTRTIDEKELTKDADENFKYVRFRFYESETGNKKHIIQLDEDNFYRTELPPTKIPPGKYFVLGDNRDFSLDSRFWGLVAEKNIKGKALMVWLSLVFKDKKSDPWIKIRPWRIGKIFQ
ncbi:MAG: signal peptidase I [Halobacteriovoraceae bacterium]|nr:signal peptidase I [Halobacteriovoraceae bacterium]